MEHTPSSTPTTSFTIGQVYRDAFASFRRRFGQHVGFNAAFLACLFASSCVVGCVLVGVIAAIGVVGSGGGRPPGAPQLGVVAAVYGLFIVVFVVAFSMHQGFTLALSDADLRGEAIDFGTALRRGASRLGSLVGAMLVRYAIDWSFGFIVVGIVVAALGAQGLLPRFGETSRVFESPVWLFVLFASYVGWIVWILVVRCFVGLSGPAAQLESLGPIDATARSVRLLAGHRVQFGLLRLAWAALLFVIILIAEIPLFVLVFAMRDSTGAPGGNPMFGILMLPVMLVFYAVGLLAYSFDSVLDAAYYGRVAPHGAHQSVADVFS